MTAVLISFQRRLIAIDYFIRFAAGLWLFYGLAAGHGV